MENNTIFEEVVKLKTGEMFTISETIKNFTFKKRTLTKQTILKAIKEGKLKGYFFKNKWHVKEEDLKKWEKDKFNHNLRKDKNGQPLFDGKTTFSTSQATKIISSLAGISFKEQNLYYYLYVNRINYRLYGATKIFHISDILAFIEQQRECLQRFKIEEKETD